MGRAFEYRRAAKERRWGKMSKTFPKIARAIQMAAAEGGADPETNSKLRTAIQNAKAENMPKENIENAIKRATNKDVDAMHEVIFEGKGPHGVLTVVECMSDNNNRTVANIKSYFNKFNGSIVPSGSLEFMFSRKAMFEFKKPEGIDLEELELNLIDGGLEKIEEHEDSIFAYADFTNFGNLQKALDEQKIPIIKSGLLRFANTPVEFDDNQTEEIEKFLERLDEDDDVQAVYTNMG